MTGAERRITTMIVGSRIFTFEIDDEDVPSSLGIVVSVDGGRRWSSEEPGWRDLALGVDGLCVYWWSARRLMALVEPDSQEVLVIDSDEDILWVFRAREDWILVCETSVQLRTVEREGSRIELADVIQEARWDGALLVLRDDSGTTISVEAGDGRLRAIP